MLTDYDDGAVAGKLARDVEVDKFDGSIFLANQIVRRDVLMHHRWFQLVEILKNAADLNAYVGHCLFVVRTDAVDVFLQLRAADEFEHEVTAIIFREVIDKTDDVRVVEGFEQFYFSIDFDLGYGKSVRAGMRRQDRP